MHKTQCFCSIDSLHIFLVVLNYYNKILSLRANVAYNFNRFLIATLKKICFFNFRYKIENNLSTQGIKK
jgi:hypothetical protein